VLVRQRHVGDCVVAALAMFVDRDYDYVLPFALPYFKDRARRDGIARTSEILRDMGFRQDNLIGEQRGTGREFRSLFLPEYHLSPNLLRDHLWGRPALMSVPSLNREGGKHMVYCDGTRVWDPQEGRRGKKYYADYGELMPTEAHIWREREVRMR
jgi:hypothetical protein